jgi:hypothetical protein
MSKTTSPPSSSYTANRGWAGSDLNPSRWLSRSEPVLDRPSVGYRCFMRADWFSLATEDDSCM